MTLSPCDCLLLSVMDRRGAGNQVVAIHPIPIRSQGQAASSLTAAAAAAAGDLRERGHLRAGLLRVQLRRVHGVRRQRAAAAARRPGGRHGRHPMLLLRPRALAGPLAGMVRHLLRRLLVINYC